MSLSLVNPAAVRGMKQFISAGAWAGDGMLAQLRNLDALIALGGAYPRETFEGVDRLILIAWHGVGYDNNDQPLPILPL